MKNRRTRYYWIRLLLIALFLAALPPNQLFAGEAATETAGEAGSETGNTAAEETAGEAGDDTDGGDVLPTGRLAVMLDDAFYLKLPHEPPVVLTLYQIGFQDPEGGKMEMYEDFVNYGVLDAKTTSEMVRIAEAIAEDIAAGNPTQKPDSRIVTLSGGRVSISGFSPGIYLGVLKSGPEGIDVDPFILSFPNMEEEEENYFDFAVTLKAVYTPPGEPPGPGPDQGQGEGGEGEGGQGGGSTPRKGTTTTTRRTTSRSSTGIRNVRTGDDSQIRFWTVLMLTGAAGLMILILYRRRRPFRDNE